AIPNRSAAAEFPPLSRPRFGGLFQRGIFEWFGRITGNRIEAPCELSAVGVVCGEKSAHRKLSPADADDDFAFRDSRRHGVRVVVLRKGDARSPHRLAGLGIQSFEPAVDHTRDDLPLIY